MTLRELSSKLADAGIESARADTLRLAEHASGIGDAVLMARFDDDVAGEPWYDSLAGMIRRRVDREPLQYILGTWEFYGDEYTVTPDTLIPRPETELIVDYVISGIPARARIADLCCGSGCIGIAVCRRTDAVCDSIDVSDAALAVARRNADTLSVRDRITFLHGDVLCGSALPGLYDVIVSNPPYVKTAELDSLEPELSFEPVLALDGGHDGMIFYRRIIENYKENLADGGSFVFEIGAALGDDITALSHEHGFCAELRPDLSGLPRMAVLKKPT